MRWLIATSLSLCSCSAVAAEPEWYAFGGFGFNAAEAQVTPELRTGALLSIGVGWPVSQRLSVEASLARNESTWSSFALTGSTWRETRSSWTGWSVGVHAVGELPLTESAALIGRAGVSLLRSDLTERVSDTTIGSGVTLVLSDMRRSSTDLVPSYGIGASYVFAGHLKGRALIEEMRGASSSGLEHVRTVSIELIYKF